MLICDRFPSIAQAEAFKKAVKDRFQLEAYVCQTEAEARQYDIFPFRVDPIIVMVVRPMSKLSYEAEDAAWQLAIAQEDVITNELLPNYGGQFAGT